MNFPLLHAQTRTDTEPMRMAMQRHSGFDQLEDSPRSRVTLDSRQRSSSSAENINNVQYNPTGGRNSPPSKLNATYAE